ncbi:MAG TPA: zf-HC2 domain-containing protein [Candidatus Acidoferrales bacterium]|nr:zf-HC2 domain-containing protein [Candidatus Acidoferrales bacterium]
MSSCVRDSRLRGLVDNELPQLQAHAVREHLASCASCAGRFTNVSSARAEVRSLMDALAPAIVEPIVAPEIVSVARREFWPRVSWISAVAAVLVGAIGLLAFIHAQQHVRGSTGMPGKSLANLPVRVPSGGASATLTVEVSATPGGNAKHSSAKRVMTFVRVDGGEPIEGGTIVRVKLPAAMFSNVNPVKTPEIAADAVVDESGRVRAIRVLGSDGSNKE